MTDHRIGPDPEFERWLAEAAPTLNEPPATPRDEMWQAIAGRGVVGVGRGARRVRSRAWIFPAALAAAAVMGIVIDRAFVREQDASAPSHQVAQRDTAAGDTAATDRASSGTGGSRPTGGVERAAEPSRQLAANDPKPKPPSGTERTDVGRPTPTRPSVERSEVVAVRPEPRVPQSRVPSPESRVPGDPRPTTLRFAAAQTLAQAELVLAAYRTGDTTEARQLGRWARDVLSSTRLLLESRTAADPQLRALLQDLELVLMQIAQLSGAPLDRTERELLDKTLRDRDLLPRLRTNLGGGAT